MRGRLLVPALLAALVVAAPAQARDQPVTSFDQTTLSTTFLPATTPGADGRSPTIMVTHGWGATRTRSMGDGGGMETFGQADLKALRDAGYNLLTWDSRGFGESGGTVSVDGPDFEGRDVQSLLDWLATQPEQQLDAPGDPRAGMHGPSYAGGIELVAAGLDRRIDAIAPAIAWHSLETSLAKNGAPKGGWASALVGLGSVTAPALGVLSPFGPETGALDSRITSAFTAALATGSFPEPELDWFRSRGPGDLVDRIRAPTLLVQGTTDTLFTPHEAVVNQAILKRNRVPVQMLWFCGGHGVCNSGTTPTGLVTTRVVAWMDRWLKGDASVDTGPAFEWTGFDGGTRSAADYPVASAGSVKGAGKGTLAITPVDSVTSGALLIAATPALGAAVKVPLEAPAADTEIVGAPRLSLRYSGTGTGLTAPVHVYAQVVDTRRNLVIGNQVTPVPVTLDGKPQELSLDLEEIATKMTPGDRFELQLVPGSGVYLPQRALGTLTVSSASIALPAVDPAATRPSTPPNVAQPRGGSSACKARRSVRLRVSRVRGRAVRVVRVRVAGRKGVRRVRVRRDGRVVRRTVRVSLRGATTNRVKVRLTARTVGGKRVRVTRVVRRCA